MEICDLHFAKDSGYTPLEKVKGKSIGNSKTLRKVVTMNFLINKKCE